MDIRYRHSDQINELAEALCKAQSEMEGAKKDSVNPHFKNKYADLESVWEACRKPLANHGLAVLQPVAAEGARVTVSTVLAHKSGQWFAADLDMTAQQNTPQSIGSAITYGRRYGLSSMVGIAPEDDDGNEGSVSTQQQPQRQESRAKKAAPPPPADNRTDEQAFMARLTGKFEILGAFSDLKTELKRTLGEEAGESAYRAFLKSHGVEKSDQFKTVGEAKTAAVDLWRKTTALKVGANYASA